MPHAQNPADPPPLPATLARVLQNELIALSESTRNVLLCSGERIGSFAGRFYYRFEVPEHLIFRSVSAATFSFGFKDPLSVDGSIVSVENQYLTVALPIDFGHVIPETRCTWEFEPQLKPVIDMLSSLNGSSQIVSFLLDPSSGSNLHAVGFEPQVLAETPADQLEALRKILHNRVSFLWGPILSGKTHVLAHVAVNYIKAGKRVLFVDTVNERVDDVLLRSREIGTDLGVDLAEVTCSVGLPAVENFGKLDKISFEAQVDRLKDEKRKSFQERVTLLDTYRKIRIKQILHEDYTIRLSESRERLAERKKQIDLLSAELSQLRESIQRIQSASMIDRLKKGFGKEDLSVAQKQLEEKTQLLKRHQTALTALTQESLRLEAHAPISGEEVRQLNLTMKRLEELGGLEKVQETVDQYTSVDERSLLDSKLFIGTTLASALSDRKLLGMQFDLVIVDDAEGIPLPYLLSLGAMAREKMLVSGDPYQLGPESALGTPDALQWLRRDVFFHVARTEQLPAMFDFTQKNSQWCILLSSHFASTPKLSQFIGSVIFDDRITVFASPKAKGRIFFIDTSALRSQAKQYVGKKKIMPYNEMHTKKLLELLKHALLEPGRNARDLGIVLPFPGPGLYVKQQLRLEGMGNIEVGTPHSFRGRRKKAILFDTVMAGVDYTMRPIDDRKVGEHQIVRLLNTVFSCVEEDLYVLADLTHFQELYKDRLLTRFLMLLKSQADPGVNFAQAAKLYDDLDWDKKAVLLSPTAEATTLVTRKEESILKDDAEFAVHMKLMAKKEGLKPEPGARNFERETFASAHRTLGMHTDVNYLSQYAGTDLLFHHTYSTEQALASIPVSPCLSEKDFRILLQQWNHLLFITSGGSQNEGTFFKRSAETRIRWDTNALHRFYAGEISSEEDRQKAGMVVSKMFQELLGKASPGTPQEWHTAYTGYLSMVEKYLRWISSELRR